MGVIIALAGTIGIGAIIIGLCVSSGRAKLEREIMILRKGEEN
jgi:hypothetical protein